LLSGDDAKPPVDSVWLWLPELFKLLDAVADNEPLARRFAAAWYYTATEVDFSNDSDDEERLSISAAMHAVMPAPKSASRPPVRPLPLRLLSMPMMMMTMSTMKMTDDADAADDDDDDDDDGEDLLPEGDDEDEEIVDDADENDAVDAFTDMADAMAQGGRENAIEALGRMMSAAAANGETLTARRV
jgi:hypothetical protein